MYPRPHQQPNLVSAAVSWSCANLATTTLDCQGPAAPGDVNHRRQSSTNKMDNYDRLGVIGRGGFGVCYLCRAKNDKFRHKVVIKTVMLDGRTHKEVEAISREAELLSRLAHPNIIAFYEHFISGGVLHMVIEYAQGGTMEQLIRDQNGQPLQEDTILYYFTQTTMALDYIHSKKILHRDLKTQNILMNRKRTIVRLADFGIAKELSNRDACSTLIGTPNYMSPEACEGRKYDHKSDLWSLGCVLFELIELKRAFDGESFPAIVVKITTGKVEAIKRAVSDKLRELVNVLLSMNEKKRPSTKEILTSPLVLPKCLELHLDLGRIDWPEKSHFAAKNCGPSVTSPTATTFLPTTLKPMLRTQDVPTFPCDFYLDSPLPTPNS